MRKVLITGLILMSLMAGQSYAQAELQSYVEQKTFNTEIVKLQKQLKSLKQAEEKQKKEIAVIDKKLSDMQKEIRQNDTTAQERISEVTKSANNTQDRIKSLGQQLGQRTIQFIWGTVLVGIFGLAALILCILVRKRYSEGNITLEKRLSQVRDRINDEVVKLDEKFVELLKNQMNLLQVERNKPLTPALDIKTILPQAIDHSLPLRVGEEIFRMRQRLSALPPETKGLKPLQKSLERLEEEFNQQGYEMVNLLGLKYDEGMSVKGKFIASDDLEVGQAIITKVIKPQINFNGVSIQDAEIEVSTGG